MFTHISSHNLLKMWVLKSPVTCVEIFIEKSRFLRFEGFYLIIYMMQMSLLSLSASPSRKEALISEDMKCLPGLLPVGFPDELRPLHT